MELHGAVLAVKSRVIVVHGTEAVIDTAKRKTAIFVYFLVMAAVTGVDDQNALNSGTAWCGVLH